MTNQFAQIGSFIVLTRMLIHLSTGKKNEKYMKALAGMLIIVKIVTVFSEAIGRDNTFEYQLSNQKNNWEKYMKEIDGQTILFESKLENTIGWQESYVERVLEQAEEEE